MKLTRRTFLKGGMASGASLLLPAVSGMSTAYGSTENFKALVCIFLHGGNDAYNMVVPTSSQQYSQYQSIRPNIAIAYGDLVDIGLKTDNQVSLGLHPAMASLTPAFQAGNATVIVNSGQLIEPVVGRSNPVLPPFLMAHNHQQTLWKSGAMNLNDRFGWAGRMVDEMYLTGSISPIISMNSEQKWLRSESLEQLVMTPGKPGNYEGLDTPERLQGLDRHFNTDYRNLFKSNYSDTIERRYLEHKTLKQYLDELDNVGSYPDTSLGRSLETTARLIRIRGQLGHKRQIYFVGMGGFDTHKDQKKKHEGLLQQLADGMAAFHLDIDTIGLNNNVTTFTMSDFGRRIMSNETGTDHGWAGHQLIMGGAVKGQKAYGIWPDLSPGSQYDHNKGRIIPEIAADQVNATLATWFGYNKNPETLFPSLNNGFDKKLLDFLPITVTT